MAGLDERSRRPHRSPLRMSAVFEDAIVEIHKRLSEQGLDAGAASVHWHLCRDATVAPPSVASVFRALRRRGFTKVEPKKRPRSSFVRFEAPAPNVCWQIDATEWRLAGGEVVSIINIIDDHSRVSIESLAVAHATTEAAWEAFCNGAARYGLPLGCLSDNGMAFSGKLRRCEVYFEAQLRAAGVKAITSRPYHPQTCGKVERFQQTLKKWLRRHPARSLAELQATIVEFRQHYNHERPHRGIGRRTPWQRWCEAPAVSGPDAGLAGPVVQHPITINARGAVSASRWKIHVGAEYAGRTGVIVMQGLHARVFVGGDLVRDLDLDPTRHYQPSGRPTGHERRYAATRQTTVNAHGNVNVSTWTIAVGAEHAARPATVELVGAHAKVWVDGCLVRDFDINTAQRYQPSGRPRGPRRRRS
jgi:transposase InsO family protein